MSMVERTLFGVIRDGLTYFTEDEGARFERWLRDYMNLEPAEAAKGRIYFAGGTTPDGDLVEARPPTLVHGYPRTGGPFPCWALTLGSERESATWIGDDTQFLDSNGEAYYDPDTGAAMDPQSRRVEYSFSILVIADHPDVTIWYYHLLKQVILRNHDVLIARDIDELQLSGADLAPDPRYLPNDVFARQLSVSVQCDEPWYTPLGNRGTSVTGMGVEYDPDAAADGAVNGGITVYTTESE